MAFQNLHKGNLLIAEPSLMGDSSFSKSVVLLADLNENGSVGFILNKPLKLFLNDLVKEIEMPLPIYKGGPVEQDSLYFVHKVPELIHDSIQIDEDLYWGGDYNDLVEGINSKKIKIIFFVILFIISICDFPDLELFNLSIISNSLILCLINDFLEIS